MRLYDVAVDNWEKLGWSYSLLLEMDPMARTSNSKAANIHYSHSDMTAANSFSDKTV